MTALIDDHNTIDISTEPDGRVRMTVTVDGEDVAAPTFRAADVANAFRTIKQIPADTREAALQSIAKALGVTDHRSHWPELVLRQFEADGLTITNDPGSRP